MESVKERATVVAPQTVPEPEPLDPVAVTPQTAQSRPRRAVIAALLRRELQLQSESYRFRVTVALLLALMLSAAWMHSVRYRAQLADYEQVQAAHTEALEGARVADLADIVYPAAKPPWPLGFVVDGEQSRAPNIYRQGLSAWIEPELERYGQGLRRLPAAEALDWLFVIRLILSLAAFVLGYDAICGAAQHASLKMTLSYPVGRHEALVAKLIALWVCLAVPFVLSASLSLLLFKLLTGVSLGGQLLAKVAGVAILGLWAIAVYVLMAVMVSALNRDASRSLAVLTLIWVTAVVVIPAGSGLAAVTLKPMEKGFMVNRQIVEAAREVEAKEGAGSWRSRPEGAVDGYALERDAAEIQNRRVEKQDALRRQHALGQLEQQALARDLAAISPMQLIQDLAERLVSTGPYRDRVFLERAWGFRTVLQRHVERLDRADPDSPQIHFFFNYLSFAPIDPEAVPRFELEESTFGEGLARSWKRLAALGLTTVFFALAALLAFARYDVG
ncbi:MAG: ABC transporter permease subunit [Acidobacteriota bacterium]